MSIAQNSAYSHSQNVAAAELLRPGDIVESVHNDDWHAGLDGEIISVDTFSGIVLVDFGEEARHRGHDGNGNTDGSKWFCRAADLELIEEADEDEEAEAVSAEPAKTSRAANLQDPQHHVDTTLNTADNLLSLISGLPYKQAKAAMAMAFFTICIADPSNTTPAKAMADMLELTLRGEKVVKSMFDTVKSGTVVVAVPKRT